MTWVLEHRHGNSHIPKSFAPSISFGFVHVFLLALVCLSVFWYQFFLGRAVHRGPGESVNPTHRTSSLSPDRVGDLAVFEVTRLTNRFKNKEPQKAFRKKDKKGSAEVSQE